MKKYFVWGLVVLVVIATGLIVRIVTPSVYDIGTRGPEWQVEFSETSPQEDVPEGVATFRGGWRMSDENVAKGPQSYLIECRKEAEECIITGMFMQTNFEYMDQEIQYFDQEILYFKVTGWTEEGVITAEQKAKCGDYILTADVRSATASLILTRDQTKEEECGSIPDEARIEVYVLDEIESSVFSKVRKPFQNFCYNSDFCYSLVYN